MSSRTYEGFLAVKTHWNDKVWKRKSETMEFKRFHTLQTAGAASKFMLEAIQEWEVANHLQTVITEDVADMCLGMELLHSSLKASSLETHHNLPMFTLDVLPNLSTLVSKCMSVAHSHISMLRSLLNYIQYFLERRDIFKSMTRDIGDADLEVSEFDFETR